MDESVARGGWCRPTSILDWVNYYRRLGFCVVPAIYGQKRPSVDWRIYQKRKPTNEEIWMWFSGGDLNIAIVCGKVSGNLVVQDFDDIEVYKKFFDVAKIESEGVVVKTGSGRRHVYFRTPQAIASFRIPQLKLEVRSEGNVVIAPESLHPNGSRYEFVSPIPTDIPVVKDLKEDVWRIAGEKFGVRRPSLWLGEPTDPGEKRRSGGKPYRGRHPPCIKKLLEGVDSGFRNEAAARLASYFLFTKDFKSSKIKCMLAKWNKLNRPPLPDYEVRSVFRNVYHRGYVYGCQGLEAFCNREDCPLAEREERRFEREVAAL